MIIKVCGMRDGDNIREVEQLSIDWMGFIFYPKSSRYVSEVPAYLPTKCKRVGVFVDASTDEITKKIHDFYLDAIQLHSNESPEQISHLLSLTSHLSIIKAFNIATAEDLKSTASYTGLADYFLFDTKGASVGGNGEKFDWSVLDSYEGETPFLLSGGIGPDDAARVSSFRHPKCAGIDLNSKFESSPAYKDVTTLSRFLNEINK
jgi:phosphoribosylanthranilate isomerase